MVIIFYDANKDQIYICTEHDKTRVIPADDPHLIDYVPNDDILYVVDAHFITKAQFSEWIQGDFELDSPEESEGVTRFTGMLEQNYQPGNSHHEMQKLAQSKGRATKVSSERFYIHPTANGTVRIEDIQTSDFPGGIQLNGKWHFLAVDSIGEDTLLESSHFKVLLGKGKVEIVPESYVNANKHKLRNKKSPYQAALDAILVPADVKAEVAASGDWNAGAGDWNAGAGDIATEILIEG